MDKERIEQRIIELAREFADRPTFFPLTCVSDGIAACELRGTFQALIEALDKTEKGEQA
jgi:hypothetical protein